MGGIGELAVGDAIARADEQRRDLGREVVVVGRFLLQEINLDPNRNLLSI